MADSSSRNPFAAFGHRLIEAVWKLGFVCRFFAAILRDSGASLRRFPLVIREIYFAGVLSMIIIVVSGLFVGMVLGLQGYSTLARFGSADALGALVALSLLAVGIAGCGSSGKKAGDNSGKVIKIGATAGPHAQVAGDRHRGISGHGQRLVLDVHGFGVGSVLRVDRRLQLRPRRLQPPRQLRLRACGAFGAGRSVIWPF